MIRVAKVIVWTVQLASWTTVVDGDTVRIFACATDAGVTAVIAILALSACLSTKLTIRNARIVEVVSSVLSLS